MAQAGAAMAARREASRWIGTWLFVLSDAVALAALVSTMLVLGGGPENGAGLDQPPVVGLAMSLLAGLSLSLVLLGRRSGALAAQLAFALCLAFVGLQVAELRSLWAEGLDQLGPAGERLLVLLMFHLVHVVAGLVLLARALVRRQRIGPLAIYLHYLAGMYLLIVVLFYLL